MIGASSNAMAMEIYVSPGIKSAAELKGQKIAGSTFASETDMAVSMTLRHWSMTRKDVVGTPLGGASQLSGQVAASSYFTPATIVARETGLVRLLDLGNGRRRGC